MATTQTMSPRMKFLFARIFPLPFIIVGLAILLFGIKSIVDAQESENWPASEGTIQNSAVEYHSDSDGPGTYHAEVFYQFSVNGQMRSGKTVAFGDYGSSDPSHAQEIVNRYPKGAPVKVYYKSDDPGVCVLEPGMKTQAWFMPGFGAIFFVVGSLMFVFLPKLMRTIPDSNQSQVANQSANQTMCR